MTPTTPPPVPAPKITLDDLKHRANSVKDLAVTDAKDAVGKVINTRETKTLFALIGTVALVAGIAYYMGTRAVRSVPEDLY